MENDSLTERIIGICFDAHNELGAGFIEKVYENSLRLALEQVGLNVSQQELILVYFRDQVVGEYMADLIVNGSVLIELKTVKQLLPEHQALADQLSEGHRHRNRSANKFRYIKNWR